MFVPPGPDHVASRFCQTNAAAASSPILSPAAVNPAPVSRAPLSIGDAISSAMAERRVHVEAEDEDSDDDSEDWN